MKKRLVTGSLEGSVIASSPDILVRPCVLVYEGIFNSMDGEVEVSKAHLEKLAQNYNARMAKAREVGNGVAPDKFCPPLQLDHAESAQVTVGRLRCDHLEVKPYVTLDGKTVMGLYGEVTIIGEENVKKASDGRWVHVSIGADFDQGIISELTITPFPAAPEASLLSQKRPTSGENMNKYAKCKARLMKLSKLSEGDADAKLAKMSDEDIDKMSAEHDEDAKKLAEGDDEEKKKLAEGEEDEVEKMARKVAKHLKKMQEEESEEDPKKKLAEGEDEETKKLAAEKDEAEKKLAAEKEEAEKKLAAEQAEAEKKLAEGDETTTKKLSEQGEKLKKIMMAAGSSEDDAMKHCSAATEEDIAKAINEHEEKHHGLKKMSAEQTERFARLKVGFKAKTDVMHLALKKTRIASRLSALRSKAKITPAEIKKINIDEMAGMTNDAVEAVFTHYENREPVVHTGFLGTQKALDLTQLSAEIKKVKADNTMSESLNNMSFTKKARLAGKKGGNTENQTTPITAFETTDIEQTEKALVKLMEGGKLQEVRELLGKTFGDIKRLSLSEHSEISGSEKRVKELEATLVELSEQHNQLLTLVSELTGN